MSSEVIDISPSNLIAACTSSSPAFLMMYSVYTLNKQGNNIQPWRTPFPIWNQSVVPCPVLTVASWPAYRFLKRHGVVIHSQSDTLECKVKWALGSIITNKASGGYGIPDELLKILKDDAVQGLHWICQLIWKMQQWAQDWKRSVFIPIPKNDNVKECSNLPHKCTHLTS